MTNCNILDESQDNKKPIKRKLGILAVAFGGALGIYTVIRGFIEGDILDGTNRIVGITSPREKILSLDYGVQGITSIPGYNQCDFPALRYAALDKFAHSQPPRSPEDLLKKIGSDLGSIVDGEKDQKISKLARLMSKSWNENRNFYLTEQYKEEEKKKVRVEKIGEFNYVVDKVGNLIYHPLAMPESRASSLTVLFFDETLKDIRL